MMDLTVLLVEQLPLLFDKNHNICHCLLMFEIDSGNFDSIIAVAYKTQHNFMLYMSN